MARKRTVAATLKKARKLITPKYRWGKGAWVQDNHLPNGKAVACYCLEGAIRKAVSGNPLICGDSADQGRLWAGCTSTLQASIRTGSITEYNDFHGRTHEQVLAALDRAIAKAEKKGI